MKRILILLLSFTLSLGASAFGNIHGGESVEKKTPENAIVQVLKEVLKEGNPEIVQDFLSNQITIHLVVDQKGCLKVVDTRSSNALLSQYVSKQFNRKTIYLDSTYSGKSFIIPVTVKSK